MAQKESKLKNTLQNVGYYALLGFAKLIGYLPYFVLYRMLAPFIYFILYRVIGYRKPIVRVNLELAFPEKSEAHCFPPPVLKLFLWMWWI